MDRKVAIVTGGSRGIGEAISRMLFAENYHLAVCARNLEPLEKLKNDLDPSGERLFMKCVDVSRADEISSFARDVLERWGRVNVLVNNAGTSTNRGTRAIKRMDELTEDDWDTLMDTNLKSAFMMTRAVLPGMKERKSGYITSLSQ